jgi:hypothetical protein
MINITELEKMKIKELKKICKDNKIKNYSKLNKKNLIKLIIEKINKEEVKEEPKEEPKEKVEEKVKEEPKEKVEEKVEEEPKEEVKEDFINININQRYDFKNIQKLIIKNHLNQIILEINIIKTNNKYYTLYHREKNRLKTSVKIVSPDITFKIKKEKI